MTIERPYLLLLVDVPDLHLPAFRSNTEVSSATAPAKRGDLIVFPHIAQLLHSGCSGIPNIHRVLQRHRKYVLGTPIHQIEIEVVTQAGRIQYSVWVGSDLPRFLVVTVVGHGVVD